MAALLKKYGGRENSQLSGSDGNIAFMEIVLGMHKIQQNNLRCCFSIRIGLEAHPRMLLFCGCVDVSFGV